MIDTLELFYRWGVITEAEYLRRAYPSPTYTFEELEAANWSPAELGF